MAGLKPEEQKQLTELLKLQAEYQRQVSQSVNSYVEGVREYKRTQAEINKNKQREIQLAKELADAEARKDAKAIAEAQIKLDILKEQGWWIQEDEDSLKSIPKTLEQMKLD